MQANNWYYTKVNSTPKYLLGVNLNILHRTPTVQITSLYTELLGKNVNKHTEHRVTSRCTNNSRWYHKIITETVHQQYDSSVIQILLHRIQQSRCKHSTRYNSNNEPLSLSSGPEVTNFKFADDGIDINKPTAHAWKLYPYPVCDNVRTDTLIIWNIISKPRK